MRLSDGGMAAKGSEGSIKWQLCYDISARTWWMAAFRGQRGQATFDTPSLRVLGGGGAGRFWRGFRGGDTIVLCVLLVQMSKNMKELPAPRVLYQVPGHSGLSRAPSSAGPPQVRLVLPLRPAGSG
ncbi:hypothetical protein GOODEAATRI_023324 [Goodea atripinnis]|uniref:Uncharacterized protein n=1 Tax=Goodea atripinnis TaxID=208336 RepID=A0ABV0MUK4_9TELE